MITGIVIYVIAHKYAFYAGIVVGMTVQHIVEQSGLYD